MRLRSRLTTNANQIVGFGALLALPFALLLFRIGDIPLVGPDEPRYSRVAVEMHRSGDWVTPTLQGEPWLEKPALFYWISSAAMSLLGETESAVRVPSGLSLLLLIGATAWVGGRIYGWAAGVHSGFVLATSLLAHIYGRAASMDMLLAASSTAAIGLMILRLRGGVGPLALAGAYAFAGMACLAKGPLGLLLPLLVLGAHLVTSNPAARRQVLTRLWSPLGCVLFLIVTMPWYASVLYAQGMTFVRVFVVEHNLLRFTSEIHRHPGPFYYYLPILLIGLFPWSGLLAPAMVIAWRARREQSDRLVSLWLLVPLAFFSMAGSKLPGYILPCLPPLALLIGRSLSAAIPRPQDRGFKRSMLVGAALQLVVATLIASAPLAVRQLDAETRLQIAPVAFVALAAAIASIILIHVDIVSTAWVLRLSGALMLLALAYVAPSVLDRWESGRQVFLAAKHEEVFVWGAPRSIWMSGYFYNDGRVRTVENEHELMATLSGGGSLVFCGPEQRRRLYHLGAGVEVRLVAPGPRGSALVRIASRGSPSSSLAAS